MSPPSLPQIVDCPSCGHAVAQSSPRSGNSIGATFWTDGEVKGPMLISWYDLIRCPHDGCGAYFLGSKAKPHQESGLLLGKRFNDPDGFGDDSDDAAWEYTRQFPRSLPLDDSDWLSALEQSVFATGSEEREARITAWHLANDKSREDEALAVSYSPVQIANMLRLAEILAQAALVDYEKEGDVDEELLMRAEVLSELGDFDAAKEALESVGKDLKSQKEQIARLVAAQDRRVHPFQDEEKATQIWI